MIPKRISMVTYNLWNLQRWPAREPALRQFLNTYNPDILCLQEARQETIACIDDCMSKHAYVHDDRAGWTCESNIFWNTDYFDKIAHGLEDLDMPEPERGMFWVRLQVKSSEQTIFVATAHYTWQGYKGEIESGLTPRNKQTRNTVAHLQRLVQAEEPAFFMGDLNDPVIPNFFFPDAGYRSCFQDLKALTPPTYPALPTTNDITENQSIDWIFSNQYSTALAASVPQVYCDGIGPSDHWPVQAIYQI